MALLTDEIDILADVDFYLFFLTNENDIKHDRIAKLSVESCKNPFIKKAVRQDEWWQWVKF